MDEPKVETLAEAKAEAKAEARAEAKEEARAEAKEEVKAEEPNKYMARSFLLPALCAAAFSVLVGLGKVVTDKQMVIVGVILLSFAGVFNISEAFKTWVTLRYPQTPKQ